jgi:hypothetical protein
MITVESSKARPCQRDVTKISVCFTSSMFNGCQQFIIGGGTFNVQTSTLRGQLESFLQVTRLVSHAEQASKFFMEKLQLMLFMTLANGLIHLNVIHVPG